MSIASLLKSAFMPENHHPADHIPRQLLKQLSSIPRLTGMLPYSGWLENESLFTLDSGVLGSAKKKGPEQCLGFVLCTDPQTGANEEMEKVLASIFMSCPPKTGIQVTFVAGPHILPTLKEQANMMPVDEEKIGNPDVENRRNNNIYRTLARRRIDHYLKGTGKSLFGHTTYLLRDMICLISVTLPLNPENPSEVEEAMRTRESVHATLASAHLRAEDWGPDQLINLVADFFDHDRLFKSNSRQNLEYDPMVPIRSQMSSPEIASCVADGHIRFRKAGEKNETAMQAFSVRQYPKYFRLPGMNFLIGDPYQMALAFPCPFIITMGAIVVDYETARTKAQMKGARATQGANSYMAHFQPDLQDRKQDWDMVLKCFDNGRTVLSMYHQLILFTNADDVARAEHAARAVWRARGFDLAKDFYLQHQALTAALPMALTPGMQADLETFGRIGTKTADNAVMTSPFMGEWKGTKTPVMTLFGRRGQVMGFDLFDNQGGNYNFATAALSGSGKSVFVNEMTWRYLGSGSKVWIIDVGRSYRNLCELLDGEFIEFSDSETNRICINPFSMVLDINKDMEMILPLIAQMASPRDPLDNYGYTALASAIKRVWDAKGKKATITDVYDLLSTGHLTEGSEFEKELTRIATALEPFTKYGVYASYFEGEANIRFDKKFVVLELEELKAKKDLQSVVMLLMMYRITQEMYLDRSTRKLCIIDEAWDLMHGGSTAGFIEAGYRRARKYGGAFGTITQSVEDYYKNEATKAAINNADWLFLLRQKKESIERLGKEGKLTIDEWMKRQLSSITTEHGLYSEIFVHGPLGSGIGRLLLDPFSMLLFSTRAEDFEAITHLRRQGLTVTEAVEHILQQQGRLHH